MVVRVTLNGYNPHIFFIGSIQITRVAMEEGRVKTDSSIAIVGSKCSRYPIEFNS